MTLWHAIQADWWIGAYLLLALLAATGVLAQLIRLAWSYGRMRLNRRRTRRLIQRWADSDARRRVVRGWPADRDEDLVGESLIAEIRRRYDGLPVEKR